MNNEIVIDLGVVSKEWVSSFTTFSAFLADCPEHICVGENREAKLKEVYETVHKSAVISDNVNTDKKKK